MSELPTHFKDELNTYNRLADQASSAAHPLSVCPMSACSVATSSRSWPAALLREAGFSVASHNKVEKNQKLLFWCLLWWVPCLLRFTELSTGVSNFSTRRRRFAAVNQIWGDFFKLLGKRATFACRLMALGPEASDMMTKELRGHFQTGIHWGQEINFPRAFLLHLRVSNTFQIHCSKVSMKMKSLLGNCLP